MKHLSGLDMTKNGSFFSQQSLKKMSILFLPHFGNNEELLHI